MNTHNEPRSGHPSDVNVETIACMHAFVNTDHCFTVFDIF